MTQRLPPSSRRRLCGCWQVTQARVRRMIEPTMKRFPRHVLPAGLPVDRQDEHTNVDQASLSTILKQELGLPIARSNVRTHSIVKREPAKRDEVMLTLREYQAIIQHEVQPLSAGPTIRNARRALARRRYHAVGGGDGGGVDHYRARHGVLGTVYCMHARSAVAKVEALAHSAQTRKRVLRVAQHTRRGGARHVGHRQAKRLSKLQRVGAAHIHRTKEGKVKPNAHHLVRRVRHVQRHSHGITRPQNRTNCFRGHWPRHIRTLGARQRHHTRSQEGDCREEREYREAEPSAVQKARNDEQNLRQVARKPRRNSKHKRQSARLNDALHKACEEYTQSGRSVRMAAHQGRDAHRTIRRPDR
eukprot:scaffold28743_cov43-Phaeocystis_antarctica.AAC.3